MVGALSIVRFRTAIKDPMDLVFLFWSISVGIICGAGFAIIAVIASLYNASGLYQYNDETARTTTNVVFIVFEAIGITLFTWLAYRLFCRWQVVTHKFVNL